MEVTAQKIDLNSLFGIPNIQFTVPVYQRPYAWEQDHIDEFLSDLTRAFGGTHFMGSLVLNYEEKSKPQIVDGQQRVATIFMLLAAIRDAYQEIDTEGAGRIQALYIENRKSGSAPKFKFCPGQANEEVFNKFILASAKDSQRLAWDAFSSLKRTDRAKNRELKTNSEKIQQFLQGKTAEMTKEEKIKWLQKLEETVVTGLEFVIVKVLSVDDAFIIFETLNDRGLALSAGDLLKNHILAAAAKDKIPSEILAEDWEEMINSLNGADLPRFLRHYLVVLEPGITKNDVFPKFKDLIRKHGAEWLMKELSISARNYGAFLDPPKDWPAEIRRRLQNLQVLRAVICYSALLPARRYLDNDQFLKYLHAAEILTFRYSSVCGKGSNDLEVVYHKSAKILEESRGSKVEEAMAVLLQAVPTRDEFIAAFNRQVMGNKDVVVYMLREIERSLDSEEKEPREPKSLHIEHILPQSPDDEWGKLIDLKAQDFEEWVSRWGNLTLLGGRKNKRISNQVFEKKRDVYRGSSIKLTQKLCESNTWNFETIGKRQEWLAEHAESLWRVDSAKATVS